MTPLRAVTCLGNEAKSRRVRKCAAYSLRVEMGRL